VSRFVIDSSVAIKWVVHEDGTAEALSLRRHRLAAPDLLVPECANILWKKARKGEIAPDEARLAAGLLARACIDLMPMGDLFERALGLALALDHPAYDCIYIALAAEMDCGFVTADDVLARKAAMACLATQVIPLRLASTV